MTRHILTVAVGFVLAAPALVHAEQLAPADAKRLLDRAGELRRAYDGGDADKIVALTHPSLAQYMGGKDKLQAATRQAFDQLHAMKVAILESSIGKPGDVYHAGDELVCFVPQNMLMSVDGKKARSIGFLVAVRKIQSGEWLFLDGSGLRNNPTMLRTLLPSLSADVKMPENRVEVVE